MAQIVNNKCLTTIERDEAIVFNPETGRFLGLNRTASAIWEMLRDGWQTEEIVVAYAKRFQLDADVARRDVDKTMEAFLGHGLLLVR